MRLLETFVNFVNEIRHEEASHDIDAVQTIIDGKRDIAFVAITTQRIIDPRESINAINLAINNDLNIIPVKGRKDGLAFVIWKNNKQNANDLADFASKKEGYLYDETPEEARFVGKILSYDEDDIEDYITKNYKNYENK